MKKLAEIEKALMEYKPFLEKRFRVKEIGIFGSYARKEQKGTSDLDLLVEFSEPIGLFDFIRLEDYLAERLGIKVDLVLKSALKPRIKDKIIKEALYI
jgi:predicted nucleotidyltransferase